MHKNELKNKFDEKGFLILNEFTHKGERYVIYRPQPNAPFNFITGDKYDWEFGLRYDSTIRHIVVDYFIDDDLRVVIERQLKEPK